MEKTMGAKFSLKKSECGSAETVTLYSSQTLYHLFLRSKIIDKQKKLYEAASKLNQSDEESSDDQKMEIKTEPTEDFDGTRMENVFVNCLAVKIEPCESSEVYSSRDNILQNKPSNVKVKKVVHEQDDDLEDLLAQFREIAKKTKERK
jgi:hypothetical protein